eukprot:scaffold10321_cov69-Cyclotella_meneghiniana.AAC.2
MQAEDNAPFEWLTNFSSLRHLLLPSRIVFNPSSLSAASEGTASTDDDEETSDLMDELSLNALHVGCGTSTAGESLSCLHERVIVTNPCASTLQYRMNFGQVVNVDIDTHALESMEHRWKQLQPDTDKMEWRYIDFAKESLCQEALNSFYDSDGGYFDLVLDKSTFDCLLCAESEAVAGLLCEVYRALRVPTRAHTNGLDWGGIYIMITFHPLEFVQRMLTDLPGADWFVEHEVIRREVENVGQSNLEDAVFAEEILSRYDKRTNCITSAGVRNEASGMDKIDDEATKSAWSSGSFDPDNHYKQNVSVFTCRRLPSSLKTSNCALDRDAVCQHVEDMCNEWYKTINPMVTAERKEEISLAFTKVTTDDCDYLDLKQCYNILFTELEKEHLTFAYFLEDWQVYCEKHGYTKRNCVTLHMALDFLREMQ